jgi:hypothetical protein
MLEYVVDAICIVVSWKEVYENHVFGVERCDVDSQYSG